MAKIIISRARCRDDEVADICDDCIYSQFDEKFQNLDIHGKPILLHCDKEPFAIIRGSKACKLFISKNS